MRRIILSTILAVCIITAFAQKTDSWFLYFSNNRAVYKNNSLYGYLDPQGKQIIPARYTKAYCFNNGIAIVRDGLEVYTIDTMGQRLDHKVRIPQFKGRELESFTQWASLRIPFAGSAEYRSLRGEIVSGLITIGVDGQIIDCKNLGEHTGLAFEKYRDVMLDSPRWSAGQIDGQEVEIKYFFPLEFHQLRPLTCYPIDEQGERINRDLIYPLFEGKYASGFYGWFFRHLKFKDSAEYQRAAPGSVKVEFTIDKSGRLRDVKIVDSHNEVCSRKSIEILEKSPRWTPGTLDGAPVDVRYQMNFKFRFR